MSKIDAKQRKELENLEKMNEYEIDVVDIPEVLNWSGAKVGRFFRPKKKQVTLRIDMDTLDWFKGEYSKYQTHINLALREYMDEHKQKKVG